MKKEKFIIPIITTLLFSVALAADTQPVPPEKWQNPTTWTRIKVGQTQAQVKNILGEPTGTESTNSIEAWYYGDEPKTDENGNTERPEHGCLMFKRTPTEHILNKVVQPNWIALPTWEQLQADYKQAVSDYQEVRMAEQKRLREKAVEERQRKIEEKRKLRQRRLQAPKPESPSVNEESVTVVPTKNKHQSSSWLLDNIIIIASVIVFIGMGGIFVYKQ